MKMKKIHIIIYEKKFKQWWLTIPQILTRRTKHLSPQIFNIKKMMTYDVGNWDPGQAQKCGRLNWLIDNWFYTFNCIYLIKYLFI
jgi:hypothetical protein